MIDTTWQDLQRLLLVGALCAGVLGLAEFWRRLRAVEAEWTRKLVHVLTGLTAAAFPWILPSSQAVAFLCGVFAVFLAWSRSRGLLPSVNGVERRSVGGPCYPLAVGLVFILAREQRAVYVASILVLAVSDALAALVGRGWGRHPYRTFGDAKSLEGSAAFLASAFPCVWLPLLAMTPLGGLECLWAALGVATLAACLEAIAPYGSDNLLVPLGTCLVLMGTTASPRSAFPVAILALALAAALVALASEAPKPSWGRRVLAESRS